MVKASIQYTTTILIAQNDTNSQQDTTKMELYLQ